MQVKEHSINGTEISEVFHDHRRISGVQDFLDIMVNVASRTIILYKKDIDESFFDLKTGFAGEALQKASNYRIRLGIIGDYSGYDSRSLKDFIRESNNTGQVIFVPSLEEALDTFSI